LPRKRLGLFAIAHIANGAMYTPPASLSFLLFPNYQPAGGQRVRASLDYWEPARLPVNSMLKRSLLAVPFIESPVTVAL
jgi:hypothetical protein